MGKIKKILESELIGGTQSIDIYPVTSTKAVYDTDNKVLDDYIQHLKKTSTFAGIATPTTNPGTPDASVFYFATQDGTYVNFNNIEVSNGETAILKFNSGVWTKSTFKLMTDFDSVFDADGESLTTEIDRLERNKVNKKIGKNCVDPSNLTLGFITANGIIDTSATAYQVTDFILFDKDIIIGVTASKNIYHNLYDSKFEIVETIKNDPIPLQLLKSEHMNAMYIRASIFKEDAERKMMVAYGDSLGDYIPYTEFDIEVASKMIIDGAVTTDKLADNSITTDKISNHSIDTDKLGNVNALLNSYASGDVINYASDDRMIDNWYINANGEGGTVNGYKTTKPFVLSTDKVYTNGSTRIVLYSKNASFNEQGKYIKALGGYIKTISYIANSPYNIDDENARYAQVVYVPNNLTSLDPIVSDVEDISNITDSTELKGYHLPKTVLSDVEREKILEDANANTLSELIYYNYAYDKEHGVVGSTGMESADANYWKTQLIELGNATMISSNYGQRFAFYDADKNFIQADYKMVFGESLIVIPNDAKYCKVSISIDAYKEDWIVVLGDYRKIEYGNQWCRTLKEELLPKDIPYILPDALLPSRIYVAANDISNSRSSEHGINRSYGATLYLDRLFEGSTLPKLRFTQNETDKFVFCAPITDANTKNGTETEVEVSIDGDAKATYHINMAQASASNSKNKKIRLLCIGDSVTNGTGSNFMSEDNTNQQYWHIMNKMFTMDRIDNGDKEIDFLPIGKTSRKTESFSYNGKTKELVSMAEGNGAWTSDAYIHSETYNNGIVNPFYDGTKIGDCKFSLQAYIDRYKTLDNDGNRLVVGDTAGSMITSANIDKINMCTPTHIIIMLGTNDSNSENTLVNIKLMIDSIRDEGFNIPIAVGLPALPRTCFPELYPNIVGNNNIRRLSNDGFYIKCKTLKAIDGYDDNVYFIPTYFTMPTAESAQLRKINTIFGDVKYIQDGGIVPDLHPSAVAHAAFAQQYYSWILWTLIKQSI